MIILMLCILLMGTVMAPFVFPQETYAATATISSKPVLKSIKGDTDGVTITWEKVAGVSNYRVFKKVPGGSWKGLGNTTALTFTDTNPVAGEKYIYTVRGVSADGKEFTTSYDSTGLTITYTKQPVVTLRGDASGISLSWEAVKGAEGYRVYRALPGETSWTIISKYTTSLSFKDTDVKSGIEYRYTVRPITANQKMFTGGRSVTKKMTYTAIPKLTKLDGTATGVYVYWNAVPGATKYRVFYKKPGGGWTKIGDTTGTSLNHESAVEGQTYTYTVRCIDASGNYTGGYDTTGLTMKFQKAPVLSFKISGGSIISTWEKVSDAGSYIVYRREVGGDWVKLGTTTATSYTDKTAKKAEILEKVKE